MRGLVLPGILAGLLSLASVPAALAQESVNVIAPANKTSIVLTVPSWDAACRFNGYPNLRVFEMPAHGSVTVEHLSHVYIPSNAGSCAGKIVKGTSIVYTPSKGYHGPDSVGFGVFNVDLHPVASGTVNITVR